MGATRRNFTVIGSIALTCLFVLHVGNCRSHAAAEGKSPTTRLSGITYPAMTIRDPAGGRQQPIHPADEVADSRKTNESTISQIKQSMQPAAPLGWSLIMYESFEGVFPTGAWWVEGDPTWDDQSCLADAGTWSAWCANGGTDGIEPCPGEVHYPNNMDNWMEYGPFDLSLASEARLRFRYWLDSEAGYDEFSWYSSSDGILYSGYRYSGGDSAWTDGGLDLTERVGDSSVWISFEFASDGSVSDRGVYIDEIWLEQFVQPDLECNTYGLPVSWPGSLFVTCEAGVPVECSPRIVAGHPCYVWWSVINSGGEATSSVFYTRVLAVSGPGAPFWVGNWFSEPPLGPDWHAHVPGAAFTFTTPGEYRLELCADYENNVPESDETDNCCYAAITVSPCGCDCHCDPACDYVTDIFDVTHTVNVAFRNLGSLVDPNYGCPYQTTDVDCNGLTDIFDVTRMINVAFRNFDMATEFCLPCSEVTAMPRATDVPQSIGLSPSFRAPK
jgi:hypothetical protein